MTMMTMMTTNKMDTLSRLPQEGGEEEEERQDSKKEDLLVTTN